MNKDWTGNKATTFITLGASNHSDTPREEHDYYATEPRAIDGLLGLDVLNYKHPILEPACGEGHLSKELERCGYTVNSFDLIDRGYGDVMDFLSPLSFSTGGHTGDIVTNPPYKFAKEFVEKSLETILDGNYVCMFLKLTFLESKGRKQFFKDNPPKIVAVYSERIACARNGDFIYNGKPVPKAACYAWFIWEKGYTGNTVIKWI